MLKADVLSHFKTQIAIARALDLSKGAVSQWGDVIPEKSAYKLQILTGGVLRVNPALYSSRSASVSDAGRCVQQTKHVSGRRVKRTQ